MASTASFYGTNHGFQLGYNSGTIGPITIENHLPPGKFSEMCYELFADSRSWKERPETPPPPSSTVPFRRDPDFVDRGTLLDRILEKGSASPSRIALVGLGGVGKSQLVIEYSYQVRDRSPDTWVFWVHTSNAARFEQSYREIADRVKIPGRKDPKTNIFNLVSEWLHNEGKGKWMLILDSIDDDRFLHEIPLSSRDESDSRIPAQPLFNYLPLNAHGSIIITTRSRGVAAKMVEDGDIIAVESMDQIHAQTLFEKKLGKQENQEDIIELIAALEFMPLAIVQAAAYIKQRAPRSSVKQYLTEFQKNDYRKMSLLDYKGGQLRRDQEAKNSIILTWQISFNHLRQERPTAADLLSLMSFFDGHGIAEFLLYDRNQKGTNHDSMENETSDKDEISAVDSDVNDQFEEDIVTLRNFSFISVNMDGASFGMHGLVQLAMQKWLETNGQHEQWKQQFIQNLSKEFPKPEYRNWEKCELIFPHAQSAVAQLPHTDNLLEEWALLLNNAALFALSKGNIIEAEKMAVNVMKATKEKLGSEHESTLSSTNMKYKEAEAMNRQALAGFEKVLGVDHPDTLTSRSILGFGLYMQEKYEEAEAMHRQALAGYNKVLGVDHPNTQTSIGNLGLVLDRQGKYEEAEVMHRQALAGFEKVLGVDHPNTLTSMDNLSLVLERQGKYKEAEAMHRQALAGYNKVLGADHPDTLASLSSLGTVLERQGKYEEAEEMNQQALATREKVLGVDHPNTEIREAEPMHRQALAGYEKVLGVDHAMTLMSMRYLSVVLKKQGRRDEALEVLHTYIQLQQLKLGPDHPDTISATADFNDWQPKHRKRDMVTRFFRKQ
uniref:Kinesin light chain n=1 Tax=Talaromyces marneffei PM1 TaxID=1077442 RepID=A0A093V5K8_TALMA